MQRPSAGPVLRNLEALKGPLLSWTSWNVMAKENGNMYRYSAPGSKAFRKYIFRPSILFSSGTKAEKEDEAGGGRV